MSRVCKLLTREAACIAARQVLRSKRLPLAPLLVDERPEFYGVRSPACRMIFARCNGRLLFCRVVAEDRMAMLE